MVQTHVVDFYCFNFSLASSAADSNFPYFLAGGFQIPRWFLILPIQFPLWLLVLRIQFSCWHLVGGLSTASIVVEDPENQISIESWVPIKGCLSQTLKWVSLSFSSYLFCRSGRPRSCGQTNQTVVGLNRDPSVCLSRLARLEFLLTLKCPLPKDLTAVTPKNLN